MFTFPFIYLSALGLAYLFGQWWYSLIPTIVWTLVNALIIFPTNNTTITVLVMSIILPLLGWSAGALMSQWVQCVKPISLHCGFGEELTPGLILVQAAIHIVFTLPIAFEFTTELIIITIVLHIIFIFTIKYSASFADRFALHIMRISFYNYFCLFILGTDVLLIIASLLRSHVTNFTIFLFWYLIGIYAITIVFTFVVQYMITKQDKCVDSFNLS